mgnify:CR=1 FL=1
MKNAELRIMTKGNRGFTLYETIFSLFLVSIVIFLFPYILSYFKPSPSEKLQVKEVELFFMQISREIHGAKSMFIDNNDLIVVLHNGDRASYEQYNDLIRRRLNRTGHEVLLQHIKTVNYEVNNTLVSIQIEGKRGEQYERKFAMMGDDDAEM